MVSESISIKSSMSDRNRSNISPSRGRITRRKTTPAKPFDGVEFYDGFTMRSTLAHTIKSRVYYAIIDSPIRSVHTSRSHPPFPTPGPLNGGLIARPPTRKTSLGLNSKIYHKKVSGGGRTKVCMLLPF